MIDWLEHHLFPCFFKSHFGMECPGCGMQRSLISLLKGNIVDAITFQPIENCKMVVKTNKNRLFTTTKEIVTTNGDYAILSGFTTAETRMKKIQVEIKAAGYKTYSSFIYLSPDDCNLHSTEWNYNKNFDYNNDLPKSETVGNQTISLFNFQLVKS